MPQYTVDFTATTSVTVKVEADDPESAVDLAYDGLPQGICAKCSGWRQDWTKEEGVYEADSAYDADGIRVWGDGADSTEGTA